MQPIFFISFISVLFAFTEQEASATNIYVTPIRSCVDACQGDLVLPYDNLIFALQAAATQDSPVIILLASDTADHYALSEEVDPLLSAQDYPNSLYQISDSVFAFTTLEIKPLFCDEAGDLTLPVNTRCVERNQTVIVYFKTIRKTITVQNQLIVQNIVFNTIEAAYDYNDGINMLYYSQSICNKQRRRCCPSNEEGWYCTPAVMPDDGYHYYPYIVCNNGCPVKINPFFVIENSLAPYSTIQQNATFLNTHLQTFWGYAVSSFVEIRNSNFNLTFENCTADDIFFERGLVYIPLSDSYGYSTINFKGMEFSNYNKWYRYKTSYWYPSRYGSLFSEGYLLIINGRYQGDINILDSNFTNAISVSRRRCENMFSGMNPERYMLDPTVILQAGSEMQTNLKSLVSEASYETFVSSLIFIPTMQGSMNIENSTFKNITGIAGSVIRIIDLIEDDLGGTSSSLTLKNNVFDGNFAMSRFANIFVMSQYKDLGCPSITILNSSFLNTLGCPGSYGNVGLFCKFGPILASANPNYEEEFLEPHIIIKDSVFQNNILALSNSLAINGAYCALLEGNVFQNNGGPSGSGLMRYTFSLSPVQWDYVNFNYNRCFGQSTAVYISEFYKLTTNGNTFKGNWSPFEGSRALGISLTLLSWTNVLGWDEHEPDLTLQLQNDQFVDHTGVPPIVDPIVRQVLNCYTPPLITLANTNPTHGGHRPEIYLTGVKFENNTANYGSILDRCAFSSEVSFPVGILEQVRDVARFRSGFFRFLTSSDAADNAQAVTNTLDYPYYELGIHFSQGEIRNNTVEGGCLFPTLRLTKFLLDDLQIESNQVNPSLESQKDMTLKTQVNTDNILNNRAGIFCGFQKASVAATWNLIINANKIKAKNNIGPIFDLFPDESNYFFLMNSLFINNTCEYTSTIIASEGSVIQTSNNIFINNTNAFGTVFITSSSSFYFNAFSTYLNNDGRYASLVYGDSKTTVIQVSSRVYSNTINPNTYLFDDNLLPQGGLYFLSSSVLKMTNSIFSQNNAYAGFIISSGSTILFDRIQINDHSVFGAGLIGNFLYSSELTMTNVSITNSSITQNPLSQLESSFTSVVAGKINIHNTNISEVPTFNKAAILIGKMAQSNLTDIILSNVASVSGNGLLSLTLSNINVINLYAENTTSLFSLYLSVGSLTSIYIGELTSSSGSLYAINVISSTLTISKFKYIGGWDSGEYLSLIAGSKNRVIVSEAYFLDTLYGNNNKIFDLRESSLLLVTRSVFEYTNVTNQPVIFDLESGQTVVIEKCTFSGTGQLVQDQNTKANFYFISNTIMTDSNAQAISTQKNNVITLLDNHLISPTDRIEVSIPTSQIQIVDNSGLIKLKDSIFFSLHGSKGVVLVQCNQIPYNVESTGNTFISNTASYGSAFHLDASISNSTATLPSAVINSSTFLLNKANKTESGSGNGGAIYQTSSTFIKQDTTITNSIFISNSAEMVGGAIFFDYMPPTVDRASDFINNSANLRPNHIGSYPVRLGYYETPPQDILPALPSDAPSRLLSSSGFTQWSNMPSGITSDKSFTFALVDMFGQIFDSDNTSTLEVYPVGLTQEERYLFSNKLSIVAVNGKYVYNSFKLTYKTYGTINVIFKSTAIQENRQPPLHPPLTPLDSLLVEVRFRGCNRGEYVITDSRTISCGECQPGFWQTSPVPDALACDACDSTSTFCLGADNVGPVEGYWRLNETANIVHECPITGSCLGSD